MFQMVSEYFSCNVPQKSDDNFKNPKIFYHAFFISEQEDIPLLATEDVFTGAERLQLISFLINISVLN